jgi:hypothetical protein
MGEHALLGASSAKRWINCPGSVQLIAQLPEAEQNRSSSYAEEGNAAHAVASKCLTEESDANAFLGWQVAYGIHEFIVYKGAARERSYEVTEEMAEAIQVYLDAVRAEVKRLGKHAILLVEERVQPAPRDDMFGTADAIVFVPFGELTVFDFKYGEGVFVEVKDNEQAKFYALGAYERTAGIESVKLVIAQPRYHGQEKVRAFDLPPEELTGWRSEVLLPAADATKAPGAPLKAGEWCRFCAAAGVCPAQRAQALEAAGLEFDVLVQDAFPTLYVPDTPELLAKAAELIPALKVWSKEVMGAIERHLRRGTDIPGNKLVRKSAHRRWKREAELLAALVKAGIDEDDIFTEPKLRSPAQLEKNKKAKAIIAEYIDQPLGELVVVPTNDPRPAETLAITEFSVVDAEGDDLWK